MAPKCMLFQAIIWNASDTVLESIGGSSLLAGATCFRHAQRGSNLFELEVQASHPLVFIPQKWKSTMAVPIKSDGIGKGDASMKYCKNERGIGIVYILWIMVSSIVIFVIVVNIAKVYAVKQQAAAATQQAALAGTSVLLEATLRGVEQFDHTPDPIELDPPSAKINYSKSVNALLDEKVFQLKQSGQAEDIAYIQAMNELLPSRFRHTIFWRNILKKK